MGNETLEQIASPAVQAAFKAALTSGLNNATSAVSTTPAVGCQDELGEEVAPGSNTKASVHFHADDVPRAVAKTSMEALQTRAATGKFLSDVVSRAKQRGVFLPKPINLGMAVSKRLQPARPAREFDPFGQPPPVPLNFVPVSGQQNMPGDSSIPAGVFPNAKGTYNPRTGAWSSEKEQVEGKRKKMSPEEIKKREKQKMFKRKPESGPGAKPPPKHEQQSVFDVTDLGNFE